MSDRTDSLSSDPSRRQEAVHAAFFHATLARPGYAKDMFNMVLNDEEYGLFDWDTLATAPDYSAAAYGEKELVDATFQLDVRADPREKFILSMLCTHANIMKNIEGMLSYYVKLVERTNGYCMGLLIYNGRDSFNLPSEYVTRLMTEHLAAREGAARLKLLHLMSNFVFRIMNMRSEDGINISAIKLGTDQMTDDQDEMRRSCLLTIPPRPRPEPSSSGV